MIHTSADCIILTVPKKVQGGGGGGYKTKQFITLIRPGTPREFESTPFNIQRGFTVYLTIVQKDTYIYGTVFFFKYGFPPLPEIIFLSKALA